MHARWPLNVSCSHLECVNNDVDVAAAQAHGRVVKMKYICASRALCVIDVYIFTSILLSKSLHSCTRQSLVP